MDVVNLGFFDKQERVGQNFNFKFYSINNRITYE